MAAALFSECNMATIPQQRGGLGHSPRSTQSPEAGVPVSDVKGISPLSPACSISAEEDWSRQLRQLAVARAADAEALITRLDIERQRELRAYQDSRKQIFAAFDEEGESLVTRHRSTYLAAVADWSQQLSRLETSATAAVEEVERRYSAERAAAQASRDETTWLVGSLLDEQSTDSPRQVLQRLHVQIDGTESILQEAVRSAEGLRKQAVAFLERCRLSTEVGLTEPNAPPVSLQALQERCLEEVQQVEQPYQQLMRLWLPRCFAGATPFFLWLSLAAAMAGPTWWWVDPSWLEPTATRNDGGWIAIVVGGGAAVSLVLLLLLHFTASQRAFQLITEVFSHSRAAQALFARWERLAAEELAIAQQDLDRRHSRRKQQREEALGKAESEFHERMTELDTWRTSEIQRLQSTTAARRTHLEQSRDHQLSFLSLSASAETHDFETRRQLQPADLDAAHAAQVQQFDAEQAREWQRLRTTWLTGLDHLAQVADDWRRTARHACPPWNQLEPTTASGEERMVLLGHFETSLAEIEHGLPKEADLVPASHDWRLPASIDLTDRPALVVQFRDAAGRQAAVELLQTAMLRLLTVLPAGQVRFTILDPHSLGENFATFMHLADVDDLLINTRIWTEPGQIEERLADLTEHMETVLQMFLRNEFATLDEYNRQAGEVAEPYRVLVVSGLPTNFSDIALRRLWNIVASGARCGVIPLIAVDLQAQIPRGYSLDDLEPFVNVLTCQDRAFRWQNPELQRWRMIAEPPPTPNRFGILVKALGQLAGDVRKVEVPFHRVAPTADAIWSRSAAQKLEIPIGRAGATRTQSVLLGSGTSQHVLIAGKTGSGKSTLLHALITNAALHYSPDELELYLIDFKKGVEFKVYSRHRLPHARVIGIESDREFGVSALERLDRELQDRSALFRDAGVADLAGFRRARPQQRMPRVLLVIDEFQEFFVDDDPLAQTAALLLDRLIRQGRAFGVHVVLGSQTLAGAYSLARSTLGQVAVRIALQCSETDAHLILSEENTAARLLTRPGEAIYNDANGLSAGNHLFQVVWLDDDERDRYLQLLTSRVKADAPSLPTVVFEGNVPADVRGIPLVVSGEPRIGSGQKLTAWLGEAVSLRGALGLEFHPVSGSHLLVVGQDEVSATGILSAATLSIATASASEGQRLLVFNGSPQEGTQQVWQSLAAALPTLELRDASELDAVLKELAAEVRERDGRPGPRRWLCLFDVVRFRKLRRKDDDFGYGGFDKKEASPSDLLAEILRDGPSVGVHVWLWCDSANTVSRWLSREMQQHLENRVALAMNAGDSSQLIDTPAASRLGANRAWLFRGDRGTLDKFRPYSAPQPAAIAELLRGMDQSPNVPVT